MHTHFNKGSVFLHRALAQTTLKALVLKQHTFFAFEETATHSTIPKINQGCLWSALMGMVMLVMLEFH